MVLDWIASNLVTLGVIAAGAVAIGSGITVNSEWEEAIILRLGKYHRIKKAGLFYVWPFIEDGVRRDMRITTLDVPAQEAITKDNISVDVDAVVFLKVKDSKKSVINIKEYWTAVRQLSQTTLRDIIGQKNLDTLLESRTNIAKEIKERVDEEAEEWGIDIINIELQNIGLPADMKRAFAVQAEAEREAKAVKIMAQAELDASSILQKAGKELSKNPIALQLRQLGTLSDVSKDQSNTIILALPTETLVSGGVAGAAALSSINSSAARRKIWYRENLNKGARQSKESKEREEEEGEEDDE